MEKRFSCNGNGRAFQGKAGDVSFVKYRESLLSGDSALFVHRDAAWRNLRFEIGKFLRNLDNLIAVNQRKVDLLKREKKALLQKMFV